MNIYLKKNWGSYSCAVIMIFIISICIYPRYASAFNKEAIEQMKIKLNYKKLSAEPAEVKKEAVCEAKKELSALQPKKSASKKDNKKSSVKKAAAEVKEQNPEIRVEVKPLNTVSAVKAEITAYSAPAVLPVGLDAQPAVMPVKSSSNLDLISSINFALENNRNLKSAEKGVKLADIKIREAKAKYDPQLSYQGVLTRMDQATVMALGPMSITMADKIIQNHKINYSQALYTSKRVEYGRLMAEKYKESAIFAVDSARVNLVYMVKKGFYDLLLAAEFVKVTQESVELIAAHVQTVKNRYNAGTASKFDLLRVEVQEANTKPNLIKSVHGLTIAKNAFNNILARPIFEDVEIAGELKKSHLPLIELESALTTAIGTRDDIKSAKAALEAAETQMQLARATDKPTVALSGSYDQAKGKSYPVEKFNETWNMNLVAQVPIYDGREAKHAFESAVTAYEQKKLDFDQLIENVKLDVKIAHQELIQADELITASEKNVEQAKEALAIAQVSYDNGMNTNLEIMDAQLALTQAKTNYYQSLHDYAVAFAKLEKSMGIARIAE